MSLINEALRKARQAASEREAKPPPGAFRPAKAYPSRRSGRRGGLLAVALVAFAAAVFGAAAAWWFLGGRPATPVASSLGAPRSVSVPESTPVSPASPTQGVEAAEPVATRPLTAQSAPSREATPAVAAPVAAAEGSRGGELAPPPATHIADEPTIGPNGERVYVIEAHLGYASLELGYIVARATNPFAEINGLEVFVGSEIEGFRVEEIDADRVVLRDEKGPLVLRVP